MLVLKLFVFFDRRIGLRGEVISWKEYHPSFKLGRQLRFISLRAVIFIFTEVTIIIHNRAKSSTGAFNSSVREDYSHGHGEDYERKYSNR
jgi:hypothetical protein